MSVSRAEGLRASIQIPEHLLKPTLPIKELPPQPPEVLPLDRRGDPIKIWYDRSVFPGTWNTSCPACSTTIPRHRKACPQHG